jgi:SAM-dependent methyltransferase
MDKREYYDAEPWYQREKTIDWYQQKQPTNFAVLKVLARFITPECNVLEVACGGGWLGEEILKLQPFRYVGFDFSETAVGNAKHRLGTTSSARLYRGDALDGKNYPAGTYQLIVAHQFFHCLKEKDRKIWLNHAANALRETGGRLLLSAMTGVSAESGNTPSRFFAEESDLFQEIEKAGFAVEEKFYPEDHSILLLLKTVI